MAKLKKDVHVFGVLEEVLEADNVVVVQTAVDLDFRHQFLLGARLGECGLGDDLGRRNSFVLKVCEFVALSEAALSEELAFQVLLDADVAVEFDDLLFHDHLGVFGDLSFFLGWICGVHLKLKIIDFLG